MEIVRPAPLDPQALMTRRGALGFAAACLAGATSLSAFGATPEFGLSPQTAPGAFWSQPRWVWLKRADTGEEVRLVYWADGKLIPDAYKAISWFLRDRRFQSWMATDSPVIAKAVRDGRISPAQVTPWAMMDPVVLDICYAYGSWLQLYGLARPLLATSGFRHFLSNELTEGAALASWHPKGGALDFHIPGVPVEYVARFGQWLAGGGVGLYRSKNFTHVDRGRVRSWLG